MLCVPSLEYSLACLQKPLHQPPSFPRIYWIFFTAVNLCSAERYSLQERKFYKQVVLLTCALHQNCSIAISASDTIAETEHGSLHLHVFGHSQEVLKLMLNTLRYDEKVPSFHLNWAEKICALCWCLSWWHISTEISWVIPDFYQPCWERSGRFGGL